jgi:glycosyltransferase involved in cell wall biosynthesis
MNAIDQPAFSQASIILPVVTETDSLRKTVRILKNDCDNDIKEYLLVVCEKTIDESLAVCKDLEREDPQKTKIFFQKRPFLGGAMRDAFEVATGSHLVMMASDLETDPALVKEFIRSSKQKPGAIITATRWTQKDTFVGYSPLKKVLNFVFQKIFSVLYRTTLSDMTFGYRIFPVNLLQAIEWEELRHPFLFETVLKPLKLGIEILELPTIWTAREEGESQNTFWRNFEYFRIGLKVWRYRNDQILKPRGHSAD